jgi:hypothetical protein
MNLGLSRISVGKRYSREFSYAVFNMKRKVMSTQIVKEITAMVRANNSLQKLVARLEAKVARLEGKAEKPARAAKTEKPARVSKTEKPVRAAKTEKPARAPKAEKVTKAAKPQKAVASKGKTMTKKIKSSDDGFLL